MRIIEFVKSLLPHVDKSKVIEDIRITISELENISIPSYEQGSDYFKVNKINSDNAKKLSELFYRNYETNGLSKQINIVAEINQRLKNVKENANYILDLMEELMERDIINEGLTTKKAILLRASSSFSFISRFSIDLLNFIYAIESGKADELPPITYKEINLNLARYARLLSDYGAPNKRFTKMIGSLPELSITPNNQEAIKGTFNESDIDPFTSTYNKGFIGNPIYHIRLTVAEWQTNRYKINKDKKKMLELRLMYLKMQNEGKEDPKLEQEIDYIQGRIDKIDYYLKDVEAELR